MDDRAQQGRVDAVVRGRQIHLVLVGIEIQRGAGKADGRMQVAGDAGRDIGEQQRKTSVLRPDIGVFGAGLEVVALVITVDPLPADFAGLATGFSATGAASVAAVDTTPELSARGSGRSLYSTLRLASALPAAGLFAV